MNKGRLTNLPILSIEYIEILAFHEVNDKDTGIKAQSRNYNNIIHYHGKTICRHKFYLL